jgi:two-component system nitrate/nitrite response regulator NarL
MGHSTNLSPHGIIRILAADATSMSTQLLVEALARNPQFQVIEAAPAEAEILSAAQREKPHIALLSAKLGENGHGVFDLIRHLRSHPPAPRVIVMLDHSEAATVVQAFRAGAHGIFCRTEPFRLLTKCIDCVHSGQVWASSSELHFLLEAFTQGGRVAVNLPDDSPLSARETDVVRCVAEGLSNREIAHRLHLTEHTVKNYLFRVFDKLGVSSRVEVVLYAFGNAEARAATVIAKKAHGNGSRRSSESALAASRRNGA